MKFSEKWGDSIDNAVDLALADLKLTREEVNIIVLEEPTRGFFGIGSKLAKVRVEEKAKEKPAKPVKTEAPKEPKKEVKVEKPVSSAEKEEVKTEEKPERKKNKRNHKKDRKPEMKAESEDSFNFGEANIFGERPTDLVEQAEHPAKDFLTQITKEMGIDVNIKVSTNADCVYVDIDGPDSGTVIGKRGQTLDAVQYLTSLVVNKGESGYIRVVIDAEGYRQKREIALEKLALRLAEKAKRSGKSVRLEPMNPYERKVIHTALQKVSGVTTKSEGEEPYRRVVIEATK